MIGGLRVMRYLQGTESFGLRLRACADHENVIAYTDANFGIGRSQSGSVIKLGVNVVTWRSSKQPTGSLNVAESQVHA